MATSSRSDVIYSADHWLYLLRTVRARLAEESNYLGNESASWCFGMINTVVTEMEDVRALIASISEAGTATEAGVGQEHAPGCPRGHRGESGERRPGPV